MNGEGSQLHQDPGVPRWLAVEQSGQHWRVWGWMPVAPVCTQMPWSGTGWVRSVTGQQGGAHRRPLAPLRAPPQWASSLVFRAPSAPRSALLTPRLSPHHLLLPRAPRVLAPPRGKWAHCTRSWGQRGARNLKNQTWWRLQDSPPGPRTAPRAKGPPLTAAGEAWAPLRQP